LPAPYFLAASSSGSLEMVPAIDAPHRVATLVVGGAGCTPPPFAHDGATGVRTANILGRIEAKPIAVFETVRTALGAVAGPKLRHGRGSRRNAERQCGQTQECSRRVEQVFHSPLPPFAFIQRIVDLACRRDLLLLRASPRCTLCTIHPRRAGGGTCRADARAMQIGTHTVHSQTLLELLSGTAFD